MVELEEELDHPNSKLKNGRRFNIGAVYGVIVGVICACTLDFMLLWLRIVPVNPSPSPSPTPPLHFTLHSFNLSSSSSNPVVFSVRNPLVPFPLRVSLARASLSCTPHRLLATALLPSFRVPAMAHDRVVMVSADLSPSGAALDAPGFEFRVDGLVKIREGSKHQRMRAMKVVCKDFTAATLARGPKKCVQSWGDMY